MARIGETKCWNPACGCADAAVHRTAGGALQVRCHKCSAEGWARPGTKAHRDITAVTRLDDDQAPEPAPKNEPEPKAPATKPLRTASAFAVGNL